MAVPVHYNIRNNTFWLLPQKALYWEEQKAIIVSDLHLGKTGHFRKEGIAVPQSVYKDDLHRLFHLIQYYKPEQLIIAGDMFHSRMNKEVDLFTRWRNDVSHLHIQLVKGNHDILLDGYYNAAGITLSHQFLHIGGFCFVHDMEDVREDGKQVHSPWPIVHGKAEQRVNRASSIEGKAHGPLSIVHGKAEEGVNRQSSINRKVHSPSSIVHGKEEEGVNRQSLIEGKVHSPLPIVQGKESPTSKTQVSPTDDNPQSAIAKRKLETENWKLETNINVQPQTSNQQPVTGNPFYFSGHIHPGIVLKTGSRQSLRFPCYYFTPKFAVLPAFSAFSGMHCVSPKKADRVFAIANGNVIKMGK